MTKKEDTPLIKKLSIFMKLTPEERQWLISAGSDPATVYAGEEIVHTSSADTSVYLLKSGWACRFKLLPDGRRQILNVVLPGDFMGLRAGLFGIADHSVFALNDCQVSTVPAQAVADLFGVLPRLAMAITWSTAREEAMLAEHLVSLGRRNAYERTAHLLLELWKRLQVIDQSVNRSFDFPITQELLADLLGLSVVHVNRTLRKLRRDGMIDYATGSVRIIRPRALLEICAFDSAHIDTNELPIATDSKLEALEILQAKRKHQPNLL